jgi:ketosteroid isomerase-like protein
MDQVTLTKNKDIARRFFQAFEEGDIVATMALFAPTATYWMPTIRKEFDMREFESGLRWIQSRLKSGIRFQLGAVIAEGDKVCIMAESFAETIEGRPFNNLYHIYFQIEDGRIVYAREYNDTAHVFSTLRVTA